ncbi:hypothetical protein [Streptomyces albus]|uniref:hypothetical protein n=1 Tax=Streptomyces albus TaxID=1888 RepID=UPI0004C6539B|nr:hypothetical protein [Streptomyces albus]
MSAPAPGERPLLIVIDPVARRDDAESVRIVRDVLCAGASAKVCLPDGPEDVARHLAHRGRRRPVVVGDDLALRRIVGLLHRERELADAALAFVPVGASARSTALARELGVPLGAVPAARVVLEGTERRLDLLVDDSDGVVIGGLSIPCTDGGVAARTPWWQPALRGCRELVRGHRRANGTAGDEGRNGDGAGRHRLRVEADGVVLVDLDRPVRDVSVSVFGGMARVVIRPADDDRDGAPVSARARTVTVSGPDFRYRADAVVGGPVRTRTWTVRPGALRLTLPHPAPASGRS